MSASFLSGVSPVMAASAQSYQIVEGIGSGVGAAFEVMYIQVRRGSTILAAPMISAEYLATNFGVLVG